MIAGRAKRNIMKEAGVALAWVLLLIAVVPVLYIWALLEDLRSWMRRRR